MSEYTKGPWFSVKPKGSNGWYRVGPKIKGKVDDMILLFGNTGKPDAEHDANLVASAPEMYEALKALVDKAEYFIPTGEADVEFDAARHAIEKAEGKS